MGGALPSLGVPTGPRYYDAALEGHTLVNEEILQSKNLPPVYESGVRYRPTTSKKWKFCDEALAEGTADCEALSTWRAAELRLSGEDPAARARTYRTGPTKFHAIVERGEGYMEDPSAILGMKIKSPESYVGKLVDNFGPAAVSGDEGDGYEATDDFYNAPPPYEGDYGDPIDSFYGMGPSQDDMGPGVGPAEYGGGGDGGGGGGGGGGGYGPDPQQQQQPFGGRPGFGFGGFGGRANPLAAALNNPANAYGAPSSAYGAPAYGGAPPSAYGAPSPAAGGGGGSTFGARPGSTFPRPPAAAPSRGASFASAFKGGFAKKGGVRGITDVPLVYMEGAGDGDEFDDYRAPEFGPDDEADADQAGGRSGSAYDGRDIEVDVQPDDEGGFVSTVRVPLTDGKTVVAQSTKASSAKAAAKKAVNIARIISDNKTVQAMLPPSAKLTVAALKSDTAKKVFKSLGF